MKTIQPVTIWVNGQQQIANQFSLRIIADDLATSATFYYELINQTIPVEGDPVNTTLVNGNSSLSGQEYIDWNETSDVNDEAYTLIAAKLNLTLI